MRIGWHALVQCQFHQSEHGLFVVRQDESEDIDHLAIAARFAQHTILRLPEGRRRFLVWIQSEVRI